MDSWFFLPFPAALISAVAGPEEAKNLAGKCPPPDSGPLSDAEFEKISLVSQGNSPQARIGRFEFQKRSQLFVGPHNETLSVAAAVMETYVLTTPKDAHGQPLRMFKANLENNVSKAIDQLSGICSGILADGVVTAQEATFFGDWVRKFAPFEPVWPFTDILARVERIFADARCDEEEREELKGVMQTLCGYTAEAEPAETYSTTLPLDNPQPEPLLFPGQQFVVTGRFAYGTRRKVFEAIEALGGVCGDSAPTLTTRYLVIGVFASRDW